MESECTVPSGKVLRVAVSGKSGCGNTTTSTLLAKRLGVRLVNFTFRQLAAERGMTLAQVIQSARGDDSYDLEVDRRQVALAREGSCVLGSRLAIWMLPQADLKVYLMADSETRARRILQRDGGSLDDIRQFTAMRDQEDSLRYKKLYSIDNNDFAFADMTIDSATHTPQQIVELVVGELSKRHLVCKP